MITARPSTPDQPQRARPRLRLSLTIEGPSITADDWDGPNLKPGVLERFDAQLDAMVDHLRSLT